MITMVTAMAGIVPWSLCGRGGRWRGRWCDDNGCRVQCDGSPPTPVVVSGATYYQSGSTWYQPVYQGGQVTYVIVNPPQ